MQESCQVKKKGGEQQRSNLRFSLLIKSPRSFYDAISIIRRADDRPAPQTYGFRLPAVRASNASPTDFSPVVKRTSPGSIFEQFLTLCQFYAYFLDIFYSSKIIFSERSFFCGFF